MLPTLNDEILMLKVSMSAAEEALSHKDKFRSKEDFGSAVDIHGPAVHCHYFALLILLTFMFMIRKVHSSILTWRLRVIELGIFQ
jgi:hypothetical protein